MTTTQTVITAQELRIGNWVNVRGEPTLINAIDQRGINPELHPFQIGQLELDYGGHLCDIEPIPLTPKILEKAGFVISDDCWFYSNTITRVYQSDSNIDIKIFKLAEGDLYKILEVNHKPIQFLHQLQNLYFALTGTELNIEM